MKVLVIGGYMSFFHKLEQFIAKHPVEGKKRGFLSCVGKPDRLVRYLKGLVVIKGISDKEKPENLRRNGAI